VTPPNLLEGSSIQYTLYLYPAWRLLPIGGGRLTWVAEQGIALQLVAHRHRQEGAEVRMGLHLCVVVDSATKLNIALLSQSASSAGEEEGGEHERMARTTSKIKINTKINTGNTTPLTFWLHEKATPKNEQENLHAEAERKQDKKKAKKGTQSFAQQSCQSCQAPTITLTNFHRPAIFQASRAGYTPSLFPLLSPSSTFPSLLPFRTCFSLPSCINCLTHH
jgi:hypothetical protein